MNRLLIFLCCFIAAPICRAQQQKPNVVIIYADDLGYGDLSCYGAKMIQTPNIDKLAAQGMKFTRGHATAATCTPSRYSLLTGEYAWRKKGTNILPGDASLIVPTNRTTLPIVFKKAGYQTAAIGKWHLGLGNGGEPDWNGEIKPGPNETGFDYSFFFPATADRVPTVFIENHHVIALDTTDPITVSYQHKVGDDPTGKEFPQLLKMHSTPGQGHDQTIVNGIGRIGYMKGGRTARWTDEELAFTFIDKAKKFIRQQQERPFFLYLSLSDIHVPRMPGTAFKGISKLGYRGDAILQMDWSVGQVMQMLESLHLDKNTIVIFSSDNGPVLDDGYQDGAVTQQHGHQPTGPFRGGKYSILEGGTRVPFIIHWPHSIKPGVSDALVSQVDLLASFAAMFRQSLPDNDAVDSWNLLDAFLGKSKKGRSSYVEDGSSMAYIQGDWKYIVPKAGPKLMEAVNIETGLDTAPQLFNLKNDPAEKNNMAAANAALVQRMAAALEQVKSSGRSR